MAHVPVRKTILFSYGFTFGNIGAIIGRIWLPTLLLTLGSYYVLSPYYATASRAMIEDNAALMGQASVGILFYTVASLVLYAMIYVSLTRFALGLAAPRTFFNLALGSAEWRMYGALWALVLVMAVLVLLILLAAGLLGGLLIALFGGAGASAGALAAGKSPVVASVGLLISFFIIIAAAYLFVRLYFVLAPVTVAEEQISLGRGWQLTANNVGRLILIMLGTLGPVLLLIGLCEWLLLGSEAMIPAASTTPAQAAARMDAMRSQLPLLHALSFVFSPILFGLMTSASAFVYRTLVPPGAERAVIAAG